MGSLSRTDCLSESQDSPANISSLSTPQIHNYTKLSR
jgi:hypothetical protein